MLTLFMITIMAALVVTAAGLAIQDWRRDLVRAEATERAEPAAPESLEGVLVRQVIAHEITGPQYRAAMHRLAQRDAERHPLPGLPGDAPAA